MTNNDMHKITVLPKTNHVFFKEWFMDLPLLVSLSRNTKVYIKELGLVI